MVGILSSVPREGSEILTKRSGSSATFSVVIKAWTAKLVNKYNGKSHEYTTYEIST